MSLEEAIEAIVEAKTKPLLERIEQLEAACRAPSDDDLLTMAEACELASMSEKTITARIQSGDLVAFKPKGSREYRIRRADLRAWLLRPAAAARRAVRVQDEVERILSMQGTPGKGK